MNRRTTKVRLQVVPPPVEALNSEASSAQPAVSPLMPETRADLSGIGTFEREQCDLAVANTHVTAASVVVVVLTGDPGPVVVHYVSLQPGVGFTVHLSAPAKNATPFNYPLL